MCLENKSAMGLKKRICQIILEIANKKDYLFCGYLTKIKIHQISESEMMG
jgi:uncharacterized protein YunC (DUF1805 family)